MSDTPTTTVPTVEELRSELEHTRTAFRALAESLADEDYKKKSANPAWSVGQLMWHMAWGAQFATMGVEAMRGKSRPTPPRFLFNWINPWITRLGARSANTANVIEKYDESHAKVLDVLDTVSNEDLAKMVRLPLQDEQETVASTLRMPATHFEEHSPDVRAVLGRA